MQVNFKPYAKVMEPFGLDPCLNIPVLIFFFLESEPRSLVSN